MCPAPQRRGSYIPLPEPSASPRPIAAAILVVALVPWSPRTLLPGYSDALAYDLGLIDTELPFAQARERFHINERALKHADDPAFSLRIREHPQ